MIGIGRLHFENHKKKLFNDKQCKRLGFPEFFYEDTLYFQYIYEKIN